jgi:hypothetical protein
MKNLVGAVSFPVTFDEHILPDLYVKIYSLSYRGTREKEECKNWGL